MTKKVDDAKIQAMAKAMGRPVLMVRTLVNKMLQVCSTDEEGFAVYADGWSDARVAEAVNREWAALWEGSETRH